MRHSSPLSQPSASPASPLRVGPSSRPDSALNSSENHHETHLNLSLHSSSSHHHNVTGQSSPDAKSGSNPERRKSDDLNNIDDDGDGDDDVEPFVGRAQYLSTNLILITNYNGDTQVSIPSTFFLDFLLRMYFVQFFSNYSLALKFFCRKNIRAKAACKMLMKLTTGHCR